MLHYVRATSLTPTGIADWVNIPLASHFYESYKALAEVNGKPAVIYLDQPAADIYQVRYAYSNVAEPDDATDWISTAATNQSVASQHFLPGLLLVDDPYPRFTFWSSQSNQQCFATAAADPPACPDDWQIGPLTDTGQCGMRSSWAWWDDMPLVLHAGSAFDHLVCTACLVTPPFTLLHWKSHTADGESVGLSHLSALQVPGGIGVAYRNAAGAGSLMYAWFEGALPDSGCGWRVVEVDAGAGALGANALALTADGRPAIVYGDTVAGEIRLAIMDPPA